MQLFFTISLVIALCSIIGLAILVRVLMIRFNKLSGFATEIAHNHNTATYHFARFIVTDLQDKVKHRDLTEDEQKFFHEAREMINFYEELKKRNQA